MTEMAWRDVVPILRHPRCQGTGPIQLMAREAFYDEEALPFELAGMGTVVHLIPQRGFAKSSLAASQDELLLIADCPDDEGWLVPEDIVAGWMNRNIDHPDLEDLVLTHPLYEYLTHPDEDGLSRGGHRGELLQWAPGVPTIVNVYPPEFLPNDPEAPAINRDREAYADGVRDLLEQLEARFDLLEVELGLRFGEDPLPWADEEDEELMRFAQGA
jgi:hypothetical protein